MPSRREAPPDEQLVTRSEAAAMAGVHYNTIRHKQERGELSTVRRTGRRGVEEALIPLAEVQALRADLERSGTPTVASDRTAQTEIARLQVRIESLEAQLELVTAEKERLLDEILTIAKGKK